MFKYLNIIESKVVKFLLFGLLGLWMASAPSVAALTTNDIDSLIKQHPYYDSEATSSVCGISSSASLDRFLQSLAALESADPSHGNPTATNPYSDASGRYQYKDSTWRDRVSADRPYPPGGQYARALDAPPEIQDAVAYIEYVGKAIQYQGDVAKMTLWHIYPDAVDKPNEWATYRVGHNPTAQEYIDNVINKINSGVGSTIILGYQSAPDFQKYLDKATGGQSIPDLLINGSSIGGGSTVSCVCTPSGTQTVSGNGGVVVIDPGHGPNSVDTDSVTGLRQSESNNTPEVTEVWDVSQIVKSDLEKAGYTVTLTKQNIDDRVTFRERANIANNAGAAIAVSIHNDHGQPYSFKEVYPQEVGAYRTATSTGEKISFNDSAVAQKSREYSNIFKQEREKTEGGSVTVMLNSFDRGAGIAPGNIPMVQLFAKVPWVYSEVGAEGNMTSKQKSDYANGIANAIKKAVPTGGSSSASTTSPQNCTSNSLIIDVALKLAWPEPGHGLTPKPEYVAALKEHNPEGNTAVTAYGADCGVFVATVMKMSGLDKDYPASYTPTQETHLRESGKYEIIESKPGDKIDILRPGDILIVNGSNGGGGGDGHTLIYLGPQAGGYNEASASLPSRMPNLNTLDSLTDPKDRGNYVIARFKGQ